MTSTRSYSTPPGDPDRGKGEAYLVLARIPDVADHVQRPAISSLTQKVGSGPLEYRFDPPQVTRRVHTTPAARPTEAAAGFSTSATSSATRTKRAATTPTYERIDQPVSRTRSGGRSSILPSSDPFEIPARGLTSTLAPAIRFAMLVALFTAAGTSVLLMRNSHSRAPEANKAKPDVIVKRATITPSTTEPGVTLPTAVGPLGSAAHQKRVMSTKPTTQSSTPFSMTTLDTTHEDNEQSVTPPDNDEDPSADDFTGAETGCVYPGTGFPSAELSQLGRLPRVRTSQEVPAMARFSGTVIEAPPRQAHHDDEQSLH